MSRRQNSVFLTQKSTIVAFFFFPGVLLKIEIEEQISVRKGNEEKEEERKRMEKERKGGKGLYICGLGLLVEQIGF